MLADIEAMDSGNVHDIERTIKRHKPAGAIGYFLLQHTGKSEPSRYPKDGGYRLDPFGFPIDAPTGNFSVHFLKNLADRVAMPPLDVTVAWPRINLVVDVESESIETSTPEERDNTLRSPQDKKRGVAHSLAIQQAREDAFSHRVANQIVEQQQDLHKYGHVVEELGSAFGLARAYRLELTESMQLLASLTKRHAAEASLGMEQVRQMQEFQAEIFAMAREQLTMAQQPPPPPDYVGLAAQLLGLIKEVVSNKSGPVKASDMAIPKSSSDIASETARNAEASPATGELGRAVETEPPTVLKKPAATAATTPDSKPTNLATSPTPIQDVPKQVAVKSWAQHWVDRDESPHPQTKAVDSP